MDSLLPPSQPPRARMGIDISELFIRFFKYIFEGLVVAVAAYFIPAKKMGAQEILIIGLMAAATFAVLDLFAPSVGQSVRLGAGFGVGANLVGFGGAGGAGVLAR